MKKMPMQTLITTVVFSLFFAHQAASAIDGKTTEAIMAAEDFLLLLDTAQYVKSWETAASFFKEQVPRETWVKQISSLRPAFGKVINRRIIDARPMTQLPGAPDGQYLVIQYSTTFENKQKATETITPMLDQDGRWRVTGYFIQ